ncbi:methyltransferase domain-containing protein [candidate division KSB1 bacterium]|nr:methyltransferase domain-containing protein [candidate division KSB1 bacterium]
MQGNSKQITSNQTGIHPDLELVVRRHLDSQYRKPCGRVSQAIFTEIAERVSEHGGPLIFDSGCGTGEGAVTLARQFPNSLVVGLDKSSVRMEKAQAKAHGFDNLMLVRAETVDLWRLARTAGWKLQHHFLLYPNPWPKKQHLKRRWHAHPVFPDLLALGGTLHLRSNWRLYLEEFAFAVEVATRKRFPVETLEHGEPLSAFERKYWLSGQTLYEYVADLDAQGRTAFVSSQGFKLSETNQ